MCLGGQPGKIVDCSRQSGLNGSESTLEDLSDDILGQSLDALDGLLDGAEDRLEGLGDLGQKFVDGDGDWRKRLSDRACGT